MHSVKARNVVAYSCDDNGYDVRYYEIRERVERFVGHEVIQRVFAEHREHNVDRTRYQTARYHGKYELFEFFQIREYERYSEEA